MHAYFLCMWNLFKHSALHVFKSMDIFWACTFHLISSFCLSSMYRLSYQLQAQSRYHTWWFDTSCQGPHVSLSTAVEQQSNSEAKTSPGRPAAATF